jgi:hypothetical protein
MDSPSLSPLRSCSRWKHRRRRAEQLSVKREGVSPAPHWPGARWLRHPRRSGRGSAGEPARAAPALVWRAEVRPYFAAVPGPPARAAGPQAGRGNGQLIAMTRGSASASSSARQARPSAGWPLSGRWPCGCATSPVRRPGPGRRPGPAPGVKRLPAALVGGRHARCTAASRRRAAIFRPARALVRVSDVYSPACGCDVSLPVSAASS